jgi:serine/threonine-protein kinase RsbW
MNRNPEYRATTTARDLRRRARKEAVTPDIQLTLPARAENVAVVRHTLGALEAVLDLDPQKLSDIKLAVTEACTNVVVHAYPDGEGPMEISASLDGTTGLILVVRDQGSGIVPRPDSPGLGLGLPLIATLSDSVELGRDKSEHTEVRMTFDLTAPEEPATADPRGDR